MAKPTTIAVYVEVVSYTPDGEPVHIHYRGAGVTSGPLATSHICHTTQTDLAKRAASKIQSVAGGEYWSCDEVKAELADHLASAGMNVEIVTNPACAKRSEIAADKVARRRAGKKNLSRRSGPN